MSESISPAQKRWRRIIERQQASGQTVAAYCQDRRITQASFFAWKRRLRATSPAAGGFIEVRAVAAISPVLADGIEVCLAGDRRLRVRPGFSRDLLVELIGLLEGLS